MPHKDMKETQVHIANESANSQVKSRVLRVNCKLDIEKVYDHVN